MNPKRKGWDPVTSSLQVILEALPMLLKGALITFKIIIISLPIAFLIGLITGLMNVSSSKILRAIATSYVDIIRGTPLLVQVFFNILVCRHSWISEYRQRSQVLLPSV